MASFCMSYDPVADALYIRLKEDKVANSIELCNNVIVDYNDRGEIVGIEILNFSKSKINLNELIIRGLEVMLPQLQVQE